MRRTLLPLVLTALLACTVAVSGPATAAAPTKSDSATVKDRAGDAPAGIDLLAGSYRISPRKAIWSVRLAKLTDTTFLAFESWPLNSAWDRIAVYRENGRTVGKVYFVDNEEETTPYLRRCPGLRITWKPARAKVRAVVPRSCMQASIRGTEPFEFHVFSRFGGRPGSSGDTMPVRKLRY